MDLFLVNITIQLGVWSSSKERSEEIGELIGERLASTGGELVDVSAAKASEKDIQNRMEEVVWTSPGKTMPLKELMTEKT